MKTWGRFEQITAQTGFERKFEKAKKKHVCSASVIHYQVPTLIFLNRLSPTDQGIQMNY